MTLYPLDQGRGKVFITPHTLSHKYEREIVEVYRNII
jgi:hypothetical protein